MIQDGCGVIQGMSVSHSIDKSGICDTKGG
jgi:hypothetical protein